MLRSFAASCSRTAASNFSRTASDWVLSGAAATAERLGFFNGWLLLGFGRWRGLGLGLRLEAGCFDVVAQDRDHLDHVRHRYGYVPRLDEPVSVSKVQVLGPVEDRGDAGVFDGVRDAAEEDGALELEACRGEVV